MQCKYCGKELVYVFGRPRKYCDDCAITKKMRQDRHYKYQEKGLGTTPFSQHRKKDFNDEYDDIQKEKKRLRLSD